MPRSSVCACHLWFVVSLASLIVAARAGQSLLPSQQCGWPAVYQGGRFGPSTVKQVQYLLAAALHLPPLENASGVFTNATTTEIAEFQQQNGLQPDGFLGPMTWPVLVSHNLLHQGAAGNAVSGLQEALVDNGFEVERSGVFDAQTVAALSRFQVARGDSTQSGTAVTNQTWHLLVTQCNTSGVFWFDAGWPQGNMSVDTLSCLYHTGGLRFATFECWVEAGPQGQFWEECVENIRNAWTAGFAVGVYMFPQRYYNATIQAEWLLGNLTLHNVAFQSIMLDIEGPKWGQYSTEENREFILELRRVFVYRARLNLTVYCGSEWPQFFGSNFTEFRDYPVIYAHYDNVPSFYDFYPPYGGWTAPAGKQFWDGSNGEVICGSGALDWDWSETPFW